MTDSEENASVIVNVDVVEPPTPIKRSDLEELSIRIAEELSRYVNNVLNTPDGIIILEQCKETGKFVSEYFCHWTDMPYSHVGCGVNAPWFKNNIAGGASFFNVTVDIYEREDYYYTGDRNAADCLMTFRVSYESGDFGHGVVETRWVTERKYVWYE